MNTTWKDRLLLSALRLSAAISGVIIVLIAGLLVYESLPALRAVGLGFLTDSSWHPAAQAEEGAFNLLPMVAGTLALTLGAMLLAGPLGLLSAIFCQTYAPLWLAGLYRRVIELMAGVPSVVYGLWGLMVLAPIILKWQAPGVSLLAGILILALMVLPTMALLSDAALAKVPLEYKRGAMALGMSRARTLWCVSVPAARSGIITGFILATGRALGETMAVLMVTGNVVQYPSSLFDPIRALTSNIALEMAYAMNDHRSALFVSGLMLTLVVSILIGLAEFITKGRTHA
ncbi:MAG: phosphate ABC transporter permease subunit PstC [bacterium]|nr:phosphate ABC transporter permease subunit PstC [bacterium]